MVESKIFKDPLYDYISVEKDICQEIVDSKYFQRLRRIEQTSMRCVYPSARHDRFIHSLGTYHLAKKAVEVIYNGSLVTILENQNSLMNDQSITNESYTVAEFLTDKESKNLKFTFEMSALLHDIGHSPFSHTLEDYFKIQYQKKFDNVESKDIIDILADEVKKLDEGDGKDFKCEETFNVFIGDCKKAKPAPHEVTSCIIILQCFKDSLDRLAKQRDLQIRYCFLVRCILGALYTTNLDNTENSYKNCIIKLLNSSIDVDKLDYISRDSFISGFDNTKIDVNRLLNSLVLASYSDKYNKKELNLVFKKTALGVIQNVILSRNSLYTWIYSHHKVRYESHLVHGAIEQIAATQLSGTDPNLFISKYFSPKSIKDNLVCDDTIWNLFTQNSSLSYVKELMERSSQKVAIWKSFAEFEAFFNTGKKSLAVGDFSLKQMREYLKVSDTKEFEDYLKNFRLSDNFDLTLVINTAKLSRIEPDSILVYINNELHAFDRLFSELYKESNVPVFFYIYCSRENKEKLHCNNYILKKELIQYIKDFPQFRFAPSSNK